MTIKVLNILFSLTLGGAARTTIATAKYSARNADVQHSLALLSLENTDPAAVTHALHEGLLVPPVKTREDLLQEIQQHDIVQINWWQHPLMDEFLRSDLPACRLLGWFHCAGDRPPQVVTPELVDLMDMAVAGSFYTYEGPAFRELSFHQRMSRTRMVNGGCDFERVKEFTPKPHNQFTISYIGTVDPVKMHDQFVEMSSAAKLPDAKFVVCGGPKQLLLQKKAEALGTGNRFDFRGYVSDITNVLEMTDVFGYPLCEDTYAASELTLQEAMYCGIPAVVFPHGGLKRLVYNGFNGLVVTSPAEYAEALEYLYHTPAVRLQLGQNAASFARELFGAQRWAPAMNQVYGEMMQHPKRKRRYGADRKSVAFAAELSHPRYHSAELFIESLGSWGRDFLTSYESDDLDQLLASEVKIARSNELLRRAGLWPYRESYRNDPFLILWTGLTHLGSGNAAKALTEFAEILRADVGPHRSRVLAYIVAGAKHCGETVLAHNAQLELNALTPTTATAQVTAIQTIF